MRKRWWMLACLALIGCDMLPKGPPRWVAYYGSEEKPEAFENYDIIVFDREHHPPLESLKGGPTLFAYISIGEVRDDAAEKSQLASEKALLSENTRWKSHVVDIRAASWRPFVLAAIEDAVAQGFDGVMLDTVDSPLHWAAQQSPETRTEMQRAAIALIQSVREAHPTLKIMLNRGFELLPDAKDQLDFILAESILSNPDDSTGQFTLASPISYNQAAEQLHRVVALAPHLQVLALDYWDQDDARGMEQLYAMHRAHGFIPYVTTQDLQHHTPEPSRSHRSKRR